MDTEKHLIVSHKRPQASDLLYIYLVKNFATESIHRGVSNGIEIEFLETDKDLKDEKGNSLIPFIEETNEALDISFCGRGGGMYDEHGKNILDCEATLVGKKVGLLWEPKPGEKVPENQSFILRSRDGRRKKKFAVRDPKMRDLFAVVARDDTGGSPPFSLGNMIDLMHWRYPNDPEKVMRWAFRLFDAVREQGPFSKENRQKDFYRGTVKTLLYTLECVGKFPGGEKEYHSGAKRRLEEWLNKRRENPQWEALDLIDAAATMLNKPGEDLFDWLLEVITAEVERQHHFHTVTAEEAKRAKLVDAHILIKNDESEQIANRTIAVIESDDLDVHKYLSAVDLGYYAVCVIKKNSRGQVQVFPGNFTKEFRHGDKVKVQQAPYNFPMPYVTAAIREKELESKDLPVPSWFELVSDRGPASDSTWFFYSSTGWLMNGSLTMTEVQPTVISLSDIAEVVKRGFDVCFSDFRAERIKQMKSRR